MDVLYVKIVSGHPANKKRSASMNRQLRSGGEMRVQNKQFETLEHLDYKLVKKQVAEMVRKAKDLYGINIESHIVFNEKTKLLDLMFIQK